VTLVVDTSAVLAITFAEPEAEAFLEILARSTDTLMAAGTAVELYRVVQVRIGIQRWHDLDSLLSAYGVIVATMDDTQVQLAKDGMRRYGSGRGAPSAVLNFGDLFAYALARSRRAALLFKGADFAATDVEPAWRG
jgi:ribonuclease VapC